jgi:hypothetical protein
VTVLVVLALTSLSSIALAASPAAAELCSEDNGLRFEQYLAAIESVEQGGNSVGNGRSAALSATCKVGTLNTSATFSGFGGESWDRFVQYLAATEPSLVVVKTQGAHFKSYLGETDTTEW